MVRATSKSPIKITIVSLGCPKNLVDSELMLGLMARSGIELTAEQDSADLILINTCSFIEAARQEALDMIRGLVDSMVNGQKLVVAGCLVSHWGRAVLDLLPEADAFIHPSAIPDVVPSITALLGDGLVEKYVCRDAFFCAEVPRVRLTSSHTAYVRIADGCDNRCSYCTVPSIRGPYRSRRVEVIEDEVRQLVGEGVVEVNLIGQDTTFYGKDLYGEPHLPSLLRRLCRVEGLKWLRLLYAHPAHLDAELLEIYRDEPLLCRYIDLPIQHVSDRILASMGRGVTSCRIRELVSALREEIDGLAIRTTVMVGYPGETDTEFAELVNFISEIRFERLGAFAYSREEGTDACYLPGQVDDAVKQERLHAIMNIQQNIARQFSESFIGKDVDVLVDAAIAEGAYSGVGRTQHDAPDVDGHVYLMGETVAPGTILETAIVGADEYDLIGEVHDESTK